MGAQFFWKRHSRDKFLDEAMHALKDKKKLEKRRYTYRDCRMERAKQRSSIVRQAILITNTLLLMTLHRYSLVNVVHL